MSPFGRALTTAVVTLAAAASAAVQGSQPAEGWLDRPLANWNVSGGPVPPAGPSAQLAELARQCPPTEGLTSPASKAIAAAGWFPFLYFDRELVANDVEVLAGMTSADAICRPMGYHLFVFVGGRFAGTLSPEPMRSRADLSSGTVRLLPSDVIAVEFTRYGPADPPCCPSSRDTVRYAIDRSQAAPVVTPTEVRRTRGGK